MQLGFLFVTVVAALLQSCHGGFVSIRMPYLNPAGVTYINNVDHDGHLAYAIPAEAQHIGYAAAQVPAVAAVPFVKHVPTVSHVPVTKIEAQHALLEKQLDVVKPAVSTRTFEVTYLGKLLNNSTWLIIFNAVGRIRDIEYNYIIFYVQLYVWKR